MSRRVRFVSIQYGPSVSSRLSVHEAPACSATAARAPARANPAATLPRPARARTPRRRRGTRAAAARAPRAGAHESRRDPSRSSSRRAVRRRRAVAGRRNGAVVRRRRRRPAARAPAGGGAAGAGVPPPGPAAAPTRARPATLSLGQAELLGERGGHRRRRRPAAAGGRARGLHRGLELVGRHAELVGERAEVHAAAGPPPGRRRAASWRACELAVSPPCDGDADAHAGGERGGADEHGDLAESGLQSRSSSGIGDAPMVGGARREEAGRSLRAS